MGVGCVLLGHPVLRDGISTTFRGVLMYILFDSLFFSLRRSMPMFRLSSDLGTDTDTEFELELDNPIPAHVGIYVFYNTKRKELKLQKNTR